ncbi:hypothetical protein LKI_09530 [Leuconostoc kimchii IMSNU 11154]|uniref:Uncharacterized protein n=1 Tax=Leuconostoc kimchii (strain IMSNU 11154 / KCTC 2386 / IH25) TaxID=762051 RepID=D5T4H4_LEUKI|nr:hypothetical protein [Leuconostoc kimchii]ADG41445.1 hypothetical protein LKI_09530 [Leuconostoc kimchii IMSNU 11154]
MAENMIINDLERDDLEIAIWKINEAKNILNGVIGNTADTDFMAELEVATSDLDDFTEKLRSVKNKSQVMDFVEYRDRFLNN